MSGISAVMVAPGILSDSMQEEAIAALPGQRVLAPEGYNAARLLVWDLDAGRAVGELLGHVGGVSTLAVSADGRRALSACRDFVIYLLDLTALTPIATFAIEDFPIICALIANGDTAVVGDRRTLHLLRLEDGILTARATVLNWSCIRYVTGRGAGRRQGSDRPAGWLICEDPP